MAPTNRATFSIAPVKSPEDLSATISLIKAYVDWLDIDLSFQNFSQEMSNLPGKYCPPAGALFLARNAQGDAIGCVGVAPFSRLGYCEMKRLYVDPRGRGLGVGKQLAQAAVDEARRLGYQVMLLDTVAKSPEARALYTNLGFVEVEKYYETPLEDVVFYQLTLQP